MRTTVNTAIFTIACISALCYFYFFSIRLIHDIVGLLFFTSLFLFMKRTLFRHLRPVLASGAVVMSSGIFLAGVLHRFPKLDLAAGETFTLVLFTIWWLVTIYYKNDIRQKTFADPVHSFALGTWVAGTSVTGVVLYTRLEELRMLAGAMAVLNTAVWIYFLGICLRNFHRLITAGLYRRVHGIVLLSTVSTQSLVIFYSTLLPGSLPRSLIQILIFTGILFYLIGFFLLLKRYLFHRFDICTEWNNTNCILHGAVSITGLACSISGVFPSDVLIYIWLLAGLLFVMIEGVEVIRAYFRIRRFGWRKGIGVYHVSQWSRNFTFGMFYTFTMHLSTLLKSGFLHAVTEVVVRYGAWIIVALFINELLLCMKESRKWTDSAKLQKKSHLAG